MLLNIRQFARFCAQDLPILEPIYEFGAYQVQGQEERANLRPFFPGKRYVGSDMRDGPGVDEVLDLHDLALPEDSVGTALTFDTLEHVEYPWKAIENIPRVLKPDGLLILSVPMNFPIHCHPDDYWRFTPMGVESLLKPFCYTWVDHFGESDFPTSVVAVASRRPVDESRMARFKERMNKLKLYSQNISKAISQNGQRVE